MGDPYDGLRNFILSQMKERNMSFREFADFVGISQSTISRMIRANKPTVPTVELLAKLAITTHTDIIELIDLAYPGIMEKARLSATAQVIAQRIDNLPKEKRDALIALFFGEVN